MARKRKHIDLKLLKDLCYAQLTNDELAICLRVDQATLWRRYATAIKAWKDEGVSSMRRNLFRMGMAGNVAASIFFLKNFGGMSDKQELTGSNGGPIQHQFLDQLTDEQLREIAALVETAQSVADQK